MQTLFISPPVLLFNILKNSKNDFICCDQNDNFYIYLSGRLAEKFILDDFGIYALEKNKLEELLSLLDTYAPIFSRWLHKAHEHEDLKERYIFKILRLINIIKKYNLKRCLFLTASSHHLDNYCFELAFRILNLDQIFLYPIYNRLIPFKQINGIESRKRLNIIISKFRFDDLITTITKNKSVLSPSSKSEKLYNLMKANFYFSLIT